MLGIKLYFRILQENTFELILISLLFFFRKFSQLPLQVFFDSTLIRELRVYAINVPSKLRWTWELSLSEDSSNQSLTPSTKTITIFDQSRLSRQNFVILICKHFIPSAIKFSNPCIINMRIIQSCTELP